MEMKKEEVEIVRIAYLLLWGIFPIYRVRFPNLRFYFRNKILWQILQFLRADYAEIVKSIQARRILIKLGISNQRSEGKKSKM